MPAYQTVRALGDSLNYFRNVCALKQFADTPIVLLLNKTDIFRQKLEQVRTQRTPSPPAARRARHASERELIRAPLLLADADCAVHPDGGQGR